MQAQTDFSASDLVDFSQLYCGPSEGTELLINQEQVQMTASKQYSQSYWSLSLAYTLRLYGKGYFQLSSWRTPFASFVAE